MLTRARERSLREGTSSPWASKRLGGFVDTVFVRGNQKKGAMV